MVKVLLNRLSKGARSRNSDEINITQATIED